MWLRPLCFWYFVIASLESNREEGGEVRGREKGKGRAKGGNPHRAAVSFFKPDLGGVRVQAVPLYPQ